MKIEKVKLLDGKTFCHHRFKKYFEPTFDLMGKLFGDLK